MILRRLTKELIPGMILNEDIYTRDKILLLARGAVLNEENILIIKRLGYKEVSIQENDAEAAGIDSYLDEKFLQFQKSYQESREEVIQLVRFISDGNTVDIEQAYRIPHNILKEFGLPGDLFAYMSMVSRLDDYTYGHSINVSLICSLLCQWLNLPKETTKEAIVAGLLHDIGKTKISQDILQKPGRLAVQEWEEIKKHTIYGYQMLENAGTPFTISRGVLAHHEREDGCGYPNGLTGGSIPITAKIVSIADMYDAMTSDRPYRYKMCPFKVMEEFQHNFLCSLDVKILMTFLNRIADCYLGETVELSNGLTGRVVFVNSIYPARPMVQLNNGEIINLKNRPDLKIAAVYARSSLLFS